MVSWDAIFMVSGDVNSLTRKEAIKVIESLKNVLENDKIKKEVTGKKYHEKHPRYPVRSRDKHCF
jgi:hypothetical protein